MTTLAIQRFDVYGNADFKTDGTLVLYDDHISIVNQLLLDINTLESYIESIPQLLTSEDV